MTPPMPLHASIAGAGILLCASPAQEETVRKSVIFNAKDGVIAP